MQMIAAATRKMSASLMVMEPMSWVASRPGKRAGAVGIGVEVSDDLLEREGEADGGDERC